MDVRIGSKAIATLVTVPAVTFAGTVYACMDEHGHQETVEDDVFEMGHYDVVRVIGDDGKKRDVLAGYDKIEFID